MVDQCSLEFMASARKMSNDAQVCGCRQIVQAIPKFLGAIQPEFSLGNLRVIANAPQVLRVKSDLQGQVPELEINLMG